VYVLAVLMMEPRVYMMKVNETKEEWGQHDVVFAQAQLALVLQDGNSSFGPASCISPALSVSCSPEKKKKKVNKT